MPNYQRQGGVAYKANLSNSIRLATYLGNPQETFKSVHVAGTNGKGSTSHMLAAVLQEAGYTVGLYTSPHLKDFRERIRINGQPISKQMVVWFMRNHKLFFEKHRCSFFEMTVGLAFYAFAKKKVDIAIIEVGMGGRLDSTNIITPELAVVTNIGLDHTQFLGDTLGEIAQEKAGIIKTGIPVVIGEYHRETAPVFSAKSKEVDAPLIKAYKEVTVPYPTDLKGSYQMKNAQTAQEALLELRRQGWSIANSHIRSGFAKVIPLTGLKGRWQQLGEDPTIICDTAHNVEGLRIVIEQLKGIAYTNLHIILGVVTNKDLSAILPLFPKEAQYYFCKPAISRGLAVEKLQKNALHFKLRGNAYASVVEAFKAAKTTADTTDLIFIGGSTFVVAEIL